MHTKSFAASSATKAEIEEAKQRAKKEKVKPVQPDRRIWRPKVASQYEEPDCFPDATEDLEILYKNFGKPLWTNKSTLPERKDIIKYDPDKHKEEFLRNIQWQDCPTSYRDKFERIIHQFWDVFAEEGVRKPIRGAYFHVDTGQIAPICTRPPRYGPHETRVINDLVEKLEQNDIIEDDDGPWGAPIVLASKPNQEHLHWSQYTWRLCVSYRKLNAVTRPFTFPIIRCDDAVREIGDSRYFITMDLDSGYWQVPCEEKSKAKLAFFTPTGKKRWKTMPMGATNAHPVFVALVAKFKKEWDAKADALGLKDYQSQVIVDDIMISAREVATLISYFICILEILQHYRCTAKLKKCRFLPSVAEFVGLDIHPQGNSPAKAKFEAFQKLEQPKTFTDLNMLIGCFGFYQEHIPLYEVRIKRWRETQKLRPPPGSPKTEDNTILQKAWTVEDDKLLQELKDTILSEPILKRPNSNARFYLKTDWSKNAMGAALLQPDTDDEKATLAMNDEIQGSPCQFDQTKSGLRLHPIAFISRRTSGPEQSYHSYIGEACAGIWAIEKFRPYLFGREFTWLTDCSGLRKFFEGDEVPTHMVQRWRMQLLRYDFTIVHRPGRMMFECDMLSRYNMETEAWRDETEEPNKKDTTTTLTTTQQLPPIPQTHQNIKFTNGYKKAPNYNTNEKPRKRFKPSVDRWEEEEAEQMKAITDACDKAKEVWIIGARMTVIPEAFEALGIDMINTVTIDDDPKWQDKLQAASFEMAIERAMEIEESPHWLIITHLEIEEDFTSSIRKIIEQLAWKGLKAVILCHEDHKAPHSKFVHTEWCKWLGQVLLQKQWGMTSFPISATKLGATIEQDHTVYIIGDNNILDELRKATPNLTDNNLQIQETTTESIQTFIRQTSQSKALITTNEKQAQTERPAGLKSKLIAKVQLGDDSWWPVFGDYGICPNTSNKALMGPTGMPLVETMDLYGQHQIRYLTWDELAAIIGMLPSTIQEIREESWREQELCEELRRQPPVQTWTTVIALIMEAESRTTAAKASHLHSYQGAHLLTLKHLTSPQKHTSVLQTMIDRWTTIPLPTQRKWAEATNEDRDLHTVWEALTNGTILERHKLICKVYYDAWDKGKLEEEEGIIYHMGEPRLTQIRQLRRRVVPKKLRQIVITAYHATPLAGHSGFFRTYWRIAARYWWPRMFVEIKEAVVSCAHCKLANATGHESQQVLGAISSDTPFDVIAIDIWSPGDVTDKYGNVKGLTSMDTMTGFASVTTLQDATSETVARAAFASFFVPNGLPKLILLDAGSENKGMLIDMCKTLKIKYHAVSPENHNGVLCERFHRYLNKVQKISAANSQSYAQWAQGLAFAAYSWNAAPIDGTNLVRSFVAKGRDFPFPLQIAEENNPVRIPPGQGEEAIAHFETNFPLWAQQSQMLQLLIAERREKHREMQNQGRKQRQFQPGDLVIIRKQVQSDSSLGRPAKQTFKWKGIYKVMRKDGEKSYIVQKQPTVQGKGKPGRLLKYSAAVMEKIPSSMVVHKHLDTTDTRLLSLDHPLASNPLEQNLGFYKFGKYVKAPEEAAFAYDKVEDLWNIDIESDDEEEEDNNNHQEMDSIALYEATRQSRDKLFIIQMRVEPNPKYSWYVTQVDWDNTYEKAAKEQGIYHLKWLIPHHIDVKKRIRRECRYWPEVHELDSEGALGTMRPLNPSKATREYLDKQGWAFYAYDMNLLKDRLVGPFDFDRINEEPNRINNEVWQQLMTHKQAGHLNLRSVNNVVPDIGSS